jgi:hypothetical protein
MSVVILSPPLCCHLPLYVLQMAGVAVVDDIKTETEKKMKKVTETKWHGPTMTLIIGAIPLGAADNYGSWGTGSHTSVANRMIAKYWDQIVGKPDAIAMLTAIHRHLKLWSRVNKGLVIVAGYLPAGSPMMADPSAGGPMELISYEPLVRPVLAGTGHVVQLMIGEVVVAQS